MDDTGLKSSFAPIVCGMRDLEYRYNTRKEKFRDNIIPIGLQIWRDKNNRLRS
jgi:hypothetical protein